MPDVDGFEILRAIRNQAPKPKILVVSGYVALLPSATALGANLTLDKLAVSDDVLTMAVRTLI
jgi:DNA-binding NarL/FixJ family response regulator